MTGRFQFLGRLWIVAAEEQRLNCEASAIVTFTPSTGMGWADVQLPSDSKGSLETLLIIFLNENCIEVRNR